MDTGIDKAKLLEYKAALLKHLSDPMRLRLTVALALVGVVLGVIYVPLSKRIERRQRELSGEKYRHEIITDVEKLRKQAGAYRHRIGENSDTNEWVQYLLEGLRQAKVRLRDMESKPTKKVGPYRTVTLTLELDGSYRRLKGFVEWLEGSDRLVRVDSMRIEKRPGNLLMKIVVLGLIRKNASAA